MLWLVHICKSVRNINYDLTKHATFLACSQLTTTIHWPCYYISTVHVYVVNCCDNVCYFKVVEAAAVFVCVCVFIDLRREVVVRCWYRWKYWVHTRYLLKFTYFIGHCVSFYPFSFGHCIVCTSSIYGFWLPLWCFQTFLILSRVAT